MMSFYDCTYRVDYISFFARCVGYKKRIRIRHNYNFPKLRGWYLISLGIRHVAPGQKPNTIYSYDYCYPRRWMPHESEYAIGQLL